MKTEQFTGTMENAYSKPLQTPIDFAGEYEAFEKYAEIPANELPKEQEIVDFLNNKRKANARQKAMQIALDAAGIVRPTLENDEQLRLKKMYDIFIANKQTHEEARALAASSLGLVWAD